MIQEEAAILYKKLRRPSWAPSSKVYGPVWTFLYTIIFVTYAYVILLTITDDVPFVVLLPFLLNIIFNGLYTTIQFYFRALKLASVDVFLALATLVWALIVIYPYASFVTFANIPYVIWLGIATTLQISIAVLNGGKWPEREE